MQSVLLICITAVILSIIIISRTTFYCIYQTALERFTVSEYETRFNIDYNAIKQKLVDRSALQYVNNQVFEREENNLLAEKNAYLANPPPCKGDWGEWSTCDANCDGNTSGIADGVQVRSFRINPKGSLPCPSNTREEKPCSIPCDVDCQISEIPFQKKCEPVCDTLNSTAQCTAKIKYKIDVSPINNGKPCPLLEQTYTNYKTDCEVKCRLNPERLLSGCDAKCDGNNGNAEGNEIYIQDIDPTLTGKIVPPCPSEENRKRYQKCKVSCDVSCIGQFDSCNGIKAGFRLKTYKVQRPKINNGADCPYPNGATQECTTDMNNVMFRYINSNKCLNSYGDSQDMWNSRGVLGYNNCDKRNKDKFNFLKDGRIQSTLNTSYYLCPTNGVENNNVESGADVVYWADCKAQFALRNDNKIEYVGRKAAGYENTPLCLSHKNNRDSSMMLRDCSDGIEFELF